MPEPLLIGRSEKSVHLLPKMASRHGLIAGATGTGKTVTLQVLAEAFSRAGVPVFATDIKGDLSGISQPGSNDVELAQRAAVVRAPDFKPEGCPTRFWDVLGQQGHPVRVSVTEMGPLLLARLLELNETQEALLVIAFRIADDNGWLLLDLKDLRALLQYLHDNRKELAGEFGNIAAASVGAIQRRLVALEEQRADRLFGEPDLSLQDIMQCDWEGRGIVSILAADQLLQMPKLYATLLLWLLSELFEELPEIGDRPKPVLALFFDEAHLLFDNAPDALLEKIEQVVRLIRSRGVGVYFITQNPLDLPEAVLGQLGNRIQHALRAFTPKDQRSIKAVAETFRINPELDPEAAITKLMVGEALVSTLDESGQPQPVERALIAPPRSQIGPLSDAQRQAIIAHSDVYGRYEEAVDRESAYEVLTARARLIADRQERDRLRVERERIRKGRGSETLVDSFASSAVRSIGSQIGRQLGKQLVRGLLGSLLGGRR